MILGSGGQAWGQRDGVMCGSRPHPHTGFIPSPSWFHHVPRSHATPHPHSVTQTERLLPLDC